MSRPLSESEQAAIDAFLVRSQVKVVPAGAVSSEPVRAPEKRAFGRGRPRGPSAHVKARRERLRKLADGSLKLAQLAAALGVSIGIVWNDVRQMRAQGETVLLVAPGPRTGSVEPPLGKSVDKALAKRARAADGGRAQVRDRRRFKLAPVPTGTANRRAPADATGSVFPSQVFDPTSPEPILKDGANNAKIGGDVLVGRLRGARIVMLTLEERATCPRSCAMWQSCYGNSMQLAHRWRHGPELEQRLELETMQLCAEHQHVLVRLHVLGDFYSVGYVDLWNALLSRHANLTVFGFTAWGPDTAIGARIADLRALRPRQVFIRHSGRAEPWGSFTIDFTTERKQLGSAIVCPEQISAMNGADDGRHCGNCAVCWSCSSPIVFVEH